MRARSVLASLLLSVSIIAAACRRQGVPAIGVASTSGSGSAHPAGAGSHSAGDRHGRTEGEFAFAIDKFYDDQKPLPQSPWHAAGGDWTFFDAHTDDGARFGFGWNAKSQAVFTVANADDGAKLMESFERDFRFAGPPTVSRTPLKFAPFSYTRSVSPDVHETCSVPHVPWRGTRLDIGIDFALDCHQQTGVITFIPTGILLPGDHNYDLVARLAHDLRDGPRLRHSPDTDPRIAPTGPEFETWTKVPDAAASFLKFDANDNLLYTLADKQGVRLMSLSSAPQSTPLEIGHMGATPDVFWCSNNDETCVLQVSPRVYFRAPPHPEEFFSYVLRHAPTSLRTPTAPALVRLTRHGFRPSPDGQFLLTESDLDAPFDPHRGWVHRFVTASNPNAMGVTYEIKTSEPWSDAGWVGTGKELRFVIKSMSIGHPLYRLIDPRTGQTTDSPERPAGLVEGSNHSPDDAHSFACDSDKEVLITKLADGIVQHFAIHPDERAAFRRQCAVAWVSARYLWYNAEQPALLDVETLKLYYPSDVATAKSAKYNHAHKLAVRQTDQGLEYARVGVR